MQNLQNYRTIQNAVDDLIIDFKVPPNFRMFNAVGGHEENISFTEINELKYFVFGEFKYLPMPIRKKLKPYIAYAQNGKAYLFFTQSAYDLLNVVELYYLHESNGERSIDVPVQVIEHFPRSIIKIDNTRFAHSSLCFKCSISRKSVYYRSLYLLPNGLFMAREIGTARDYQRVRDVRYNITPEFRPIMTVADKKENTITYMNTDNTIYQAHVSEMILNNMNIITEKCGVKICNPTQYKSAKTSRRSYHGCPRPADISELYNIDPPFKVGFEIEKNAINASAMARDTVLFSGHETDSSCGVEMVTNILPLSAKQTRGRKVVFDLFDLNKTVLNTPTDTRAGGHITFSIKGMSGLDVYIKARKYMPLFYAVYARRLRNNYCNRNMQLDPLRNTKYSPLVYKSFGVELRLPPRVKNVAQLKKRYDLVFHLANAIQNNHNFQEFTENCMPTLKRMFRTEQKLNEITELTRLFSCAFSESRGVELSIEQERQLDRIAPNIFN